MAIIREFNLQTNAGPSIPPVIHVNQYDRGETWKFKLYQPNGQQVIPTDAAIVGIKSDGHIIANAGTVSSGVISITETEQMTAAPGKAVFEILFDDDTHGTANFEVLVEASPTEGGVASESDLSLFQEAIDSTIPANIIAAVEDWMDDNLAPGEWVIDSSLSVSGAAADAKAAGDQIRQNASDIGDLTDLVTEDQSSLVGAINETRTDLYNWFVGDIEKVTNIYDGSGQDADVFVLRRLQLDSADSEDIGGLKIIMRAEGSLSDSSIFLVNGNELLEYVIAPMQSDIADLQSQSGLTPDIKQALMDFANAVAFKSNNPLGQTYIDALEDALYPPVDLASISAVYTQSGTVYETDSLDSLKSDLVVTAHYDDQSTEEVSNYTLSGTLTVGTSVITVAYGGKTTTFNVTVSEAPYLGSEYITLANETPTAGYINDSGQVATLANNYFIDKFYSALPFLFASSSAILDNAQTSAGRVAYYDASEQFMSRTYSTSGAIVDVSEANAVYEKVGWDSKTFEYIYLLRTASNSLFVNTDKTINANGELESSTGQDATNLIPINGGADKFIIPSVGLIIRVAFYDANQNFISRYLNGTSTYIPTKTGTGSIPSNAAYFRMDKPNDATVYYPIAKGI